MNYAAYWYLIFISAIFEPGTVQVVVLDSEIYVPVVNIASKIASIDILLIFRCDTSPCQFKIPFVSFNLALSQLCFGLGWCQPPEIENSTSFLDSLGGLGYHAYSRSLLKFCDGLFLMDNCKLVLNSRIYLAFARRIRASSRAPVLGWFSKQVISEAFEVWRKQRLCNSFDFSFVCYDMYWIAAYC